MDTGLFNDPFLIYAAEKGAFAGSQNEIISFFNDVFSLIAKTKGNHSKTEFVAFNQARLAEFRNYVENNAGWKLLWNDNGAPKSEEAAQLLFLGVIKHYRKANNIDISREVNIGRGPVDFKVSLPPGGRSVSRRRVAEFAAQMRLAEAGLLLHRHAEYIARRETQKGRQILWKDAPRRRARSGHVRRRSFSCQPPTPNASLTARQRD